MIFQDDKIATETVKLFIQVIIQIMEAQIRRGRPGPSSLDYEEVYQLIKTGGLFIRFRGENPPLPEIVVMPMLLDDL